MDEQVEAFRSRPVESEYPVLWVDALYEKIRTNGRVQNMAVLVVSGVSRCGIREILAVEPMYNESEETYTVLFNAFKDRGLEKVWLVISDAHLGLQAAVRKCLLGASWQRCKVHFMRNVMARVSHRDKKEFAAKLKQIWLQPDKISAMKIAQLFIAEYKS